MKPKLRVPPKVDWESLPVNERDAGYVVQVALLNLAAYVEDFAAAGTLFDHCEGGAAYIRQSPVGSV
jgi:hypothetical protein